MIGVNFILRGGELLKKDRACVIVANHQTSLDILGMFEIWYIARKLTVIARMLLLFTGPFGLGAWLCGLIFINKGSADRGKRKMNEAIDKIKSNKTKLWIYPEGYRNHSGVIDEFKKGAFHLAVQGQIPIVPVVISSYSHFMQKSEKKFNRGDVIIQVLPEISTAGLKSEDIEKLTKTTRDLMVEKYNEINEEIWRKLK